MRKKIEKNDDDEKDFFSCLISSHDNNYYQFGHGKFKRIAQKRKRKF